MIRSSDPSPPDRRWSPRAGTAQLVQLEQDGMVWFASCHDISDSGMWLDLGTAADIAGAVNVALSPSIVFRGRIAWRRGHECGVAFERRIDREALLANTGMELRAAKVAESSGVLRRSTPMPRPAMLSAPRPAASAGGFKPGLGVTVMRAGGREERDVVLTDA